MGKPGRAILGHHWLNHIGQVEGTGGTETSKYPQEERKIP